MAGVLAAAAGSAIVCAELSHWRGHGTPQAGLRSLHGQHGITDCPGDAARDLLAHHSLQCRFYGGQGAWRIVALISAHHALVVQVVVTDPDVIDEIARAITAQTAGRFGEILIYASAWNEGSTRISSRDQLVTRIRWTPHDGFSTMTYFKPVT
jgi:hypothetical protein